MTTILDLVADLPVFPVDDRGFYHNMMSLIISQRIRFTHGRKIRERIYKILGEFKLDKIMELTEENRTKAGLLPAKWEIMKNFHAAWGKTRAEGVEQFHSVVGIGEWTIACAKIMSGDYSCGFIAGDLAVRKRLSEMLNIPRLTEKSTKKLIATWKCNDRPVTTDEKGIIFSKIWNSTRGTV